MLTQDLSAGDNQVAPVKSQRQSRAKKANGQATPINHSPFSARPSKRAKATLVLPTKTPMPSSRSRKASPAATAVLTEIPLPDDASISPDEAGPSGLVSQVLHASLIAEIRETHRRRQDFHRAEKSLTLQIKAIERRLSAANRSLSSSSEMPRDSLNGAEGQHDHDDQMMLASGSDLSISESHQPPDTHFTCAGADGEEGDHRPTDTQQSGVAFFATLPLVEARAAVKKYRLIVERGCVKLSKQLPVYAAFVEPVNGFGALGLAQIIGEAGDLSNYSNPAKLWKRMGLAVINGKSQRRVAGAGALEQGYSPVRRAIMFCIGDSLLKKQNAYRDLYLARKVTEQAKVPDGTKMLWHRRAQRYAEKRLLRDLWRAWRGQMSADSHSKCASPGSPQ